MTQFSRKTDLLGAISRTALTAALVFLVFLGAHLQANAQSDSGKVIGTVTDQTGAVISGATLKLSNVDNGLVLTATSNSAGEFDLPAVPRGAYTAVISAPRFQSQSQSITVAVTQVQDLLFKLTPVSYTHLDVYKRQGRVDCLEDVSGTVRRPVTATIHGLADALFEHWPCGFAASF